MTKIFLGLLAFVPLAFVAVALHWPPLAIFLLSAFAIVPLAKFIGDATEELAGQTGPAMGGFLNATFGNATELIISIFALEAGLIDVVKASITGSIIGNLLLVLGTAILFGGIHRERQHFNPTAAKASASMLILATIALVIPAFFASTTHNANGNVMMLSVIVSVLMIAAYIASLFFSFRTHKHLYQQEAAVNEAKWGVPQSVTILLLSTIAVAFVSHSLVSSIEPVIAQFHWTQLFIGIIFIAIVGNAAEHVSAIQAAMKDRMDLSLAIAVGSATQIVMFVAPALVLISLLFSTHMNLLFTVFELVAVIFSIFVTNAVIEDGESNWLEGTQLLIAYIIMAVAFFLYV